MSTRHIYRSAGALACHTRMREGFPRKRTRAREPSEGQALALREEEAFFSPQRGVCLNLPFTGDLDNCPPRH